MALQQRLAAFLAVEEINNAGGILGEKLNWLFAIQPARLSAVPPTLKSSSNRKRWTCVWARDTDMLCPLFQERSSRISKKHSGKPTHL
ncbi:hypothetical protein [Marinobacter sp.]|uniref:hypothetical protein n=1 Tax=Marinobacter sp. TaxID=50741 RepID=UPI00345DE073